MSGTVSALCLYLIGSEVKSPFQMKERERDPILSRKLQKLLSLERSYWRKLWPKQKLFSSLWHWQRCLWSFEPGSVTLDWPMALKELLRSGLYVEVLLGKFLIATTINYYNRRGLKRHSFIILQFWSPEIWNRFHEDKIKVSAGLRPFWRSEGKSCFFSFSSF